MLVHSYCEIESNTSLAAHAVTNWAGNRKTRKSTSGGVVAKGGHFAKVLGQHASHCGIAPCRVRFVCVGQGDGIGYWHAAHVEGHEHDAQHQGMGRCICSSWVRFTERSRASEPPRCNPFVVVFTQCA